MFATILKITTISCDVRDEIKNVNNIKRMLMKNKRQRKREYKRCTEEIWKTQINKKTKQNKEK